MREKEVRFDDIPGLSGYIGGRAFSSVLSHDTILRLIMESLGLVESAFQLCS